MSAFGKHYILLPNHQVAETDLMGWAEWFQVNDRHVGDTTTELFWISTVFLGLDHSWGRGPPVLFETMVFERDFSQPPPLLKNFVTDDLDHETHRYCTWDDAEAGHDTTVRRILKIEADATVAMIARAKENQR